MVKRKITSNSLRKRGKISRYEIGLPPEIFKLIFELLSIDELASVKRVCKKWRKIASSINIHDIILVCDITASNSYLRDIASSILELLPLLYEKNVRFGFVGYRDHDEDSNLMIKIFLSSNPYKVFDFMDKVKFKGGDDFAEAVLDGLNEGAKMFRDSNSNKSIILLCDAPPHGDQFNPKIPSEFEIFDKFPDGCPCGLEEVSVINEIRQKRINLYILGVGCDWELLKMITVFKNIMPELSVEELNKENYTGQMKRIFESIFGSVLINQVDV